MSIKGNAVEIYNLTTNNGYPFGLVNDCAINKSSIRQIYREQHNYQADNIETLLAIDLGSAYGIDVLIKKYETEENIPFPVYLEEDFIYVEFIDGSRQLVVACYTVATHEWGIKEPNHGDLDSVFKNLCRQLDGYSNRRENDGWAER